MALETEYGNFVTVEEELTALIKPAFEAKAVTRFMLWVETLKGQAKTKEFRKGGSLTASTPGEGVAPTKQELTDTVTAITAQEAVVWTELTRFAELLVGSESTRRLAQEMALALARHFDNSVLALASSVTAEAGTTATALDEDDILDGIYTLENADAIGDIAGVVSPKGGKDLRSAFKSNTAVSMNSIAQRGLENGQYNERKYLGDILGIPFFSSTQVYNDGTDDYGMLITPYAIGVTEANGGEVDILEDTDSGRRVKGKSTTKHYGVGIVEQAGVVRLRHVD